MSYTSSDDDYVPNDHGDRENWFNAPENQLLTAADPETLPDGYIMDDDVIYQREGANNTNYDVNVTTEDTYIPPMLPEEEREIQQVLNEKMGPAPAQAVNFMFKHPEGPNHDFSAEFEPPNPVGYDNPLTLLDSDEGYFGELKETCEVVKNIIVQQKAFDEAIIETLVIFNREEVLLDNLVYLSNLIACVLGSIIYRFIYIFHHHHPALAGHRQFKVQVSFSAIFKKLKKSLGDNAATVFNGDYDYLTFTKESMLTRDGVALRFSDPLPAFRCTYNTVIDLINNCLDARNVPNMDSAWHFHMLKSASVRLFTFENLIPGGHFMKIPDYIANKKACINPNCNSGCFWWCIKLGLLCNRENHIDYSKSCEEIKAEEREKKKQHTQYQNVKNIDKKFKELKLVEPNRGELPDDMPLDNYYFDKFCKYNPGIMLSVFVENPRSSIPVKLVFEGNEGLKKEVIKILFLGERGESGHYVLIKQFNRLLNKIDKCKGYKKIYCDICKTYKLASSKPCKHLRMKQKFEELDVFCCQKCMGTFESDSDLKMHNNMCMIVDKNYRVVELPDERQYLAFDMSKKSNNLTPIPVYMVADFESVLVPVHDEVNGNTEVTAKHLPCAYGIRVVSVYNELNQFVTYWGTTPEDTMEHFCDDIIKFSTQIYSYYCHNAPMKMTLEQEKTWRLARCCYICKKPFDRQSEKYRDHDHVTGEFLGTACNTCNLRRVLKNTEVPLIFHNAKGYDLHHIIKEITKAKYGCIFNGIAQNSEKIMSFTIKKPLGYHEDGSASSQRTMCDIKIIDSLLFLLKSLESLTEILKKRSKDLSTTFEITFSTLRSYGYKDEQIEALLQKNIYPYLWFDSFDKRNLPFNELKKLIDKNAYGCFTDNVDDAFKANFEKKKDVFYNVVDKFEGRLNTVEDYADLYLRCDVLQLADIIQSARRTFFATHHLDMIRYFGAPGYSWDAFLYHIYQRGSFKPELFISTEMNMVCFFMQCIRGGCSGIMKRFSQANNPFIQPQYDPNKPTKYIIYLDANNLYGWSMMQNLPCKNFRWLTSSDLAELNKSQEKALEFVNSLHGRFEGAFFEVRLEYPKELHEAHNLYPLAPERRCIKDSEVSYFTRNLHEMLNVKMNTKTPLLLQTLEDKDHYFVHWRNLKLYLELGLKLKHIYGGIWFTEDRVMGSYIELNTKLRNQPDASDFERELYKLMNNSIYGKTLENPMKYSLLHFISTPAQLSKTIAKPGFDGTVFTQDNFAIAKLKYETIKYDKPLYLGASVTELAKWKMFNFYYNVIQDYYKPPRKAELLFTDTDSLMMEITTENIYEDIAEINSIHKYCCPIDVSTFDKEIIKKYKIPCKSNKVIGAFKSETGSQLIAEFVGLRAKMYSYIVNGDESNKHLKAKGVARSSLNLLSHKNYVDCLFHPEDPSLARQQIEMKTIRAKKHDLQSVKSIKYGLSCNDTKRYVIPKVPYIETLAFGHKDIPKYEVNKYIGGPAAAAVGDGVVGGGHENVPPPNTTQPPPPTLTPTLRRSPSPLATEAEVIEIESDGEEPEKESEESKEQEERIKTLDLSIVKEEPMDYDEEEEEVEEDEKYYLATDDEEDDVNDDDNEDEEEEKDGAEEDEQRERERQEADGDDEDKEEEQHEDNEEEKTQPLESDKEDEDDDFKPISEDDIPTTECKPVEPENTEVEELNLEGEYDVSGLVSLIEAHERIEKEEMEKKKKFDDVMRIIEEYKKDLVPDVEPDFPPFVPSPPVYSPESPQPPPTDDVSDTEDKETKEPPKKKPK